jgi:5-methyltetrahydrofolate--homocysteine methyltransferase
MKESTKQKPENVRGHPEARAMTPEHQTGSRRVVYDPLVELIAYFEGKKGEKREKKVPTGTVEERLKGRIIEGNKVGLHSDLDEALNAHSALDIINNILLDGMKVVGDLFGSGQMQLPFVLQSAEAMKAAVAYLEPHMEKFAATAKGTMVIATVKGDVHDIGKNLVDIILTNNGYRVVNLGIRCPIENMMHAAEEHGADAIGMSGLLVKSTLVMKENLEVMNERKMTLPVILGGAALTRRYVEQDLRRVFDGAVLYAADAFDGLRHMESIMRGEVADPSRAPEPSEDEVPTGAEAKIVAQELAGGGPQSEVGLRRDAGIAAATIPTPPFWGTKVVKDIPLEQVFTYVNEVALIRGQWQVKKKGMSPDEYQALLEQKIYPEFANLKALIIERGLLAPAVVYGYFPCQSDRNDLIIYRDDRKTERLRFTFPRQASDRRLCLADYFASVDSGRMDVVAFHLVTMGNAASEHSARLFASDNYRDYLYFHGLSVEATEALAELWHKRVREELGIAGRDAADIRRLFAQGYQGSRYSFGYPACPNLEDQQKLMELLDGGRIGVTLTDEYQLVPEQSTTAIIVHHPEARYFNLR